jgi:hypothetical protein
MTADQERWLDYQEGEVFACRKYTQGPLAGFYAARTFGRRCFATYSETQALVASTLEQVVDVPLPPGAEITGVEAVRHDGGTVVWPFQAVSDGRGERVRLEVQDSGGEVLYYRIRYHLR